MQPSIVREIHHPRERERVKSIQQTFTTQNLLITECSTFKFIYFWLPINSSNYKYNTAIYQTILHRVNDKQTE